MNVLVLDSNPTWQALYASVLGFLGCEVDIAFQPQEVSEKVKRGQYQLIICDIHQYAERHRFAWLDFNMCEAALYYVNRRPGLCSLEALVPASRVLAGSAPLQKLEKIVRKHACPFDEADSSGYKYVKVKGGGRRLVPIKSPIRRSSEPPVPLPTSEKKRQSGRK